MKLNILICYLLLIITIILIISCKNKPKVDIQLSMLNDSVVITVKNNTGRKIYIPNFYPENFILRRNDTIIISEYSRWLLRKMYPNEVVFDSLIKRPIKNEFTFRAENYKNDAFKFDSLLKDYFFVNFYNLTPGNKTINKSLYIEFLNDLDLENDFLILEPDEYFTYYFKTDFFMEVKGKYSLKYYRGKINFCWDLAVRTDFNKKILIPIKPAPHILFGYERYDDAIESNVLEFTTR